MSISTISRDVDSYDTPSEEVSLEQHGFADEHAVQAGKALSPTRPERRQAEGMARPAR
ncbi:hypothetical protein [Caballeronia mineralivorans]|jgi:hypothetical protein|uniref:hypothetical protein n=1 Tax=Caballeronia mineralivorans TaxID=2010198 RepID=UPI0023F4D4A2|nr:hypothetical protein [Caballeronia mineralivorans]MDB5789606.1 hypothetical protein [Caballeronia mineralivorans]